MLKKLAAKIKFPSWVQKEDSRYKRLTVLDKLLDGTVYDDLSYSFYDEKDGDEYVPIEDRRPSVQYNLPAYIARTVARKLFAGAHVPRITHQNPEFEKSLKTLERISGLFQHFLQASIWGSVGSSVITFKLVDGNYIVEVWRSRYCTPKFDLTGELEHLRIAFLSTDWPPGTDSNGDPMEPGESYWFVRDLTTKEEINYRPIPENDWNPEDGGNKKEAALVPILETEDGKVGTVVHNLGFVPAQWIVNLSGGVFPDGAPTFGPAIHLSLEIDYTMSQIGRGVRYNTAPQLLVIGDLKGSDEAVIRGPQIVLQVDAGFKDASGVTYQAGDAKLLEMTGTSIDAGLKYVNSCRRLALETVSAARKDPETVHGPMSGRAMELVDDQFIDLVQELRTSFGEAGLLPLLKKMVRAGIKTGHELFAGVSEDEVQGISLLWRRLMPIAPEALVQLSSAMQVFVEAKLLDPEMAKKYISMALDLDALEPNEPIAIPQEANPIAQPNTGEGPEHTIFMKAPYGQSMTPQRVNMSGQQGGIK